MLVSGGEDGMLRVWSVDLGLLGKIDLGTPVLGIAAHDADHVLVPMENGVVLFRMNWPAWEP